MRSATARKPDRVSVSFVLLALFFAVLAVGGGASREDVLGQTFVRAAAGALLAAWALIDPRIRLSTRVPAILLGIAAALVAIQLIPLPPAIWRALPGRTVFESAASLAGTPQPWRPIATVPDTAQNALLSFIVPLAALLLSGGCRSSELPRMLTVVLVLIMGSALVGVVQFAGAGANNPLINARPGVPSGFFANRNHQALLLAIGCIVAPVWALLPERTSVMRLWIAAGCVALLLLMILATGSRAGLLLCGMALPLAALLVRGRARHALRRAPRWLWPMLLGACLVAFAILVVLSVEAERAESLRRIVAMEPGQDMRSRALPVMMQMLGTYFPVGFGFGGFDAIFRLHEPLTLLKPTYFNHAHNDFLEVVLAGGLPALLLLIATLGWWLMASVRAWRTRGAILPRLGSAIVLLVLTHSAFDYPARTPLIMALIILAALWMTSRGDEPDGSQALRKEAIR